MKDKSYYLKILYPEVDFKTIKAESMTMIDEAYCFYQFGTLKCSYPIQYTIIEKIEQ